MIKCPACGGNLLELLIYNSDRMQMERAVWGSDKLWYCISSCGWFSETYLKNKSGEQSDR
jgi:hypothetical protein